MREGQRLTGLGARARTTWGRGGCQVWWALDVGLDSLASLILLCLSIARTSSALRSACAKLALSYQEERAIINGRRHRSRASAHVSAGMTCLLSPPGVVQKKTRVFLSADPGLPASKPGFAHGQIWVFSQAKTADIDPKPPHRPAQG